ncbi:unnamed protein product [Chondrus crispus]|uniref:Uncharacterized protein n=1 Tax=Chondrus crispus TaxID=2769 RepID=R7Q3W7_CHOCR|nr:unnamed protein product [Chondrus crispus]CDF32719.1 unnamed protein product [Chondrus crispus]|eukprot:XP_005712490.1 unnamed protein product [Chondrus crispus]
MNKAFARKWESQMVGGAQKCRTGGGGGGGRDIVLPCASGPKTALYRTRHCKIMRYNGFFASTSLHHCSERPLAGRHHSYLAMLD